MSACSIDLSSRADKELFKDAEKCKATIYVKNIELETGEVLQKQYQVKAFSMPFDDSLDEVILRFETKLRNHAKNNKIVAYLGTKYIWSNYLMEPHKEYWFPILQLKLT